MKRKWIITLVCIGVVLLVVAGINNLTGDAIWDWNHCYPERPCAVGEGDCDDKYDCLTNVCSQNVGEDYGQNSGVDVCECLGGTVWNRATQTCTYPLDCTKMDFTCDGKIDLNDANKVTELWKLQTNIDLSLVRAEELDCPIFGSYLRALQESGNNAIPDSENERISELVFSCM